MKYEDLYEMPEYPAPDIVEKLCFLVLDESQEMGIDITMERIDELSDKQWHTYEWPSDILKERITCWLEENWNVASNEYFLFVLGVGYCFALNKTFFKKALDQYNGEHKKEFEDDYNNSPQDFINPWWSLGPRSDK